MNHRTRLKRMNRNRVWYTIRPIAYALMLLASVLFWKCVYDVLTNQ